MATSSLQVLPVAPLSGQLVGAWSHFMAAEAERGALLGVRVVTSKAVVRGAFQRDFWVNSGSGDDGAARVQRASGGPTVTVGRGSLHVALSLPAASALTDGNPQNLVNRYVRPLLAGLTRGGALAHYFGRDWVSVQHRPAAWVGYAHERGTGRALFEAFVGVSEPFAPAGRPSFREKEPGSLEQIVGRAFDAAEVAQRIADQYAKAYDGLAVELPGRAGSWSGEADARPAPDPPWDAEGEEPIGSIAAGEDGLGRMRVGGDLLVSSDALTALEARVAAIVAELGPSGEPTAGALEAISEATRAELTAPGTALHGVRSPDGVARVIQSALRVRAARIRT
jgi:hypothetical protein